MASDAGSDTPWTMVDDDASLVGGATTQNHAADQYVWLRGAIAFVDVGVDEYGHLARKVGSRAAAEVILLAVCRVCGDDVSKWNRAKKLGIPWQQKRWTAITELQTKYNTAVARKVMPSVAEDLTTLGVDTPGFGGLSAAASSVGGSASAIMAADPAGQSMVGGEDQQSMVAQHNQIHPMFHQPISVNIMNVHFPVPAQIHKRHSIFPAFFMHFIWIYIRIMQFIINKQLCTTLQYL